MTSYNPTTDANKFVQAGTLFDIMEAFAEAMTRPADEVIAALGYTPIDSALMGVASGVATLDSNGTVPSTQLPSISTSKLTGTIAAANLPSYVDDVLEYDSSQGFPATGEAGKIYVAKDTNLTYRWSGSGYVEISKSLALGTTSATALRGDYGQTAYNHATDSSRLTTATASGLYKIAVTSEGHVASVQAVSLSDVTAVGVAEAVTASTTEAGLMSSSDKEKLDETTAGIYVGTATSTPGENDFLWIQVDPGAQMTADV